ncbi:MAG: T9SS type A sorting domain-containing protein [Saprospiraceae bacterium]|nr:T9SS type A sorting domain-containing protein [Saprospiraceae bacterium]
MKPILIVLLAFHCVTDAPGQSSFCPNDPPLNPWLADSPYPIYHRNSYAQASTCIQGIMPDDSISIKMRGDITGGTSPWIYFSEKYPDGARTILYSNATHVFKFIDNGTDLITIDSLRIDFESFNSFGYNFLLSKNKVWFTYDPKYNPANNQYTRLFKLTDADTTDPYADIVVLDTFNFGDYGINKVNMYNLNYNGEIVWYAEEDVVNNIAFAGVIDQNFNMLDTLVFSRLPNERINHNSIAVDENNTFYIVTSHRLIAFDWDGTELTIGWQALYDFVDDGPTGNFAYGSGTTPTLMGWGTGNDKLVVVADGHANNNLVAFWRELPPGWAGIPGMPLRFADSIAIPNAQSFSNLFQSIENSPTAYGYDIAIAQFNGFLGYDCDNFKGVSKFRWDTNTKEFNLEWTNASVNINGVLAYSSGSNLVYGTGKELDCNYYYYGLNWDNGNLELRYLLGREENFPDDPFYDQGVNHIIDEDGSIYYSGSKSLIKLQRHPEPVSTGDFGNTESAISLYPNPTSNQISIDGVSLDGAPYYIYSIDGRLLKQSIISNQQIDLEDLPNGMMLIKFSHNDQWITRKAIKNGW